MITAFPKKKGILMFFLRKFVARLFPGTGPQQFSVADLDPVGSGHFGSPGSGSGKKTDPNQLSAQTDPCKSIFSGYTKLSKMTKLFFYL